MRAHLVALSAALGAWFSISVALPVLLALAVLACWRRHIALVVLLVFVVVGNRAEASINALDPPLQEPFAGWVELLDDPKPRGLVSAIATVRHDSRRLVAVAHGGTAARLDDSLTGERLLVRGEIKPIDIADNYQRWRHVVGRVTVTSIEDRENGSPVSRFANSLRRTLNNGATSLDRSDKAVFLGMVIGDDRGQTAVVADNFRAAGLGHLLVVSGQNVAFVLAVVAPLVGRFRPGCRALWLIAVLLMFAVITRFEPSVLRAVAMAGAGVGASALGTPIDGRHALSWAVSLLLLIDPFLIHLVAFQLSVAATGGIVWWSGTLARRLIGPGWLRVPFATTAAAQLAVSPLLLAYFGPLPLASLPANLLAGPISGLVMVWGCTAGLLAGITGGVVADIIHLPSQLMLWWIGGVAASAARAPQAMLGVVSLLLLGLAGGLVMVQVRAWSLVAAALTIAVIVFGYLGTPTLTVGEHPLVGESKAMVASNGDMVLILDNPQQRRLIESLRLSGGKKPKLVLALDGDRLDAEAVLALMERYGEFPVLAPPLHRVPGASTAHVNQVVALPGLTLRVEQVRPRLFYRVVSPTWKENNT